MTIEVRAVRVNTPSPIISKELGNVIEVSGVSENA